MAIPTLRSKNQVTLPADLVEMVGLHVGEPLRITVDGGRIVIKPFSPSEDWLTEDVIAEIDKGAQGPFLTFSSMEDMERNLDV